MLSQQTIHHTGRVVAIDGRRVTVAVRVNEACASCASRKACSLGTASDERRIVVIASDAEMFAIGEQVRVEAYMRVGMVAVALCYGVPLVVLVGTLAGCIALGVQEGAAALASLSAIALYYGALWLGRNRISKKISFTISKID